MVPATGGLMLQNQLFQGKLVRLCAEDTPVVAGILSKWSRDSEYWRLLASDPARIFSVKSNQNWLERELGKENPNAFDFFIRALQDDRLIGTIGLGGIAWTHGDAFVGIGLGERAYWGKGYGTDAMRLILRFAFIELSLHRVSLDVFAYNPRAIKSYEKAGFKHEGQMRQMLHREGRRWDMVFMGITREDWECLDREP
jgi:RimJ/RimL family protein N-acetyltransferase